MEIASRWLVLVLTVVVGSQAFGRVVTVSDKQDLLDAVSASVDDEGRLREDLEVVFAADCKAMTVDPEEFPSVSEQGLLDGNGHVFRLDADACPYGTVTIGREPGGEAAKVRPFAFRGCGQGSGFKNLIFIGLGCVDFVCPMDTMVKDCDFVRCGAVSVSLCEQTGGAIRGCAVVDGCGFDGCQARAGGALSDCGYVRESVFLNCRAYDAGGAIVGATDVSRCEFHGCSCVSAAANDGFGGAIYGGRDITSCLFVDCSAKAGGAIMTDARRPDLQVRVVHCTFIRCQGEAEDESVREDPDGRPVWMLNCLCYGCACWQCDADEGEKFGCFQLLDAAFFTDYARGDFHPDPALPETWSDPCGLRFNDTTGVTQVYGCRDLDGFGYDWASPWVNCPGCYRFRTVERQETVVPKTARPVRPRLQPKKVDSPSVRRGAASRSVSSLPRLPSVTSVRNRPVKVVSGRKGPELLDLSELPCEITQHEILPATNLLDYVFPWYWHMDFDVRRFYELVGPLKMPRFGETPGYGCPGEILPYEEDADLKAMEEKYGFRPWRFRYGFLPKEKEGCDVAFLFSRAPGKGPLPLVIYIAGSGEQGTDIKEMFRQIGLFEAVRNPGFAATCPCHLLAIMPPKAGAIGDFGFYPRETLDRLIKVNKSRTFADVVFALQRKLEAEGGGTIDPEAVVLCGLGSGATTAIKMMRIYPGRYAGVCAVWPSLRNFLSPVDRHRPGRWWFLMPEGYHVFDDVIDASVEAYRKDGAEVKTSYCPSGERWWDCQYSSPEFNAWLADCFAKGPLHGARLVVAGHEPKPKSDLLLMKTGPDEATYYGTREDRPGGFPPEAVGECISDLAGIRYLYVDAEAGEIPPEAFRGSPDLRTVHFRTGEITNASNGVTLCGVTNIASRAFAESPNLNLVFFDHDRGMKIAHDAFVGCAAELYGASVGIPITTNGVAVNLMTVVLPVDGLFAKHLLVTDARLHCRWQIEDDFLWSEEGEGACAFEYLGESRDVFVPERLGGRPVVSLGRYLLPRRDIEYGIVAIPETVQRASLFSCTKITALFAAGEVPGVISGCLTANAVVYGTTPNPDTGRLLNPHLWKGKEVVVPKGTDPRAFFAVRTDASGF